MKRFFFALPLLFAAPAFAADCTRLDTVGVNVGSWHSQSGHNNFNPGVRIQTACGVVGGAYYNSERRLTAYVGYAYDPDNLPVWGSIVAATGYKSITGWDVSPLVMVGLKSPEIAGMRFRVLYIPKVPGVNPTHVVSVIVDVVRF